MIEITTACTACGACLVTCPEHALRPILVVSSFSIDAPTASNVLKFVLPMPSLQHFGAHMSESTLAIGRWTPTERTRIFGILAVIVGLHIAGWSLFLLYSHSYTAAGSFAGAGVLAYVLGCRHAFDADHIAAIDDTTRLMLQRGKRPVGVGFFFAMGHSTVVLVLALIVAFAGRSATVNQVNAFRHFGATLSTLVAMIFLLLVAILNALVLRGIVDLWHRMTRGEWIRLD